MLQRVIIIFVTLLLASACANNAQTIDGPTVTPDPVLAMQAVLQETANAQENAAAEALVAAWLTDLSDAEARWQINAPENDAIDKVNPLNFHEEYGFPQFIGLETPGNSVWFWQVAAFAELD